jgi:ADP-heptose:LPS heptosyltransferase
LSRLELSLKQEGRVIPSASFGRFVVGSGCRTCGFFWEGTTWVEKCKQCGSTALNRAVFSELLKNKKKAVHLPKPSKEKMHWAKKLVQSNTVGIFARNRKCYGRNLQPEFYIKLIEYLRSHGFNVIWLGEKQTTHPCPVEDVLDFSRMPESRDLENTLAIICNLKFTIQLWTASSRLSGMMGIPFIIVESPDQIYQYRDQKPGQEGLRLELSSFGPKKIVISHFLSFFENHEAGLSVIGQSIDEMQQDNYEDLIGLVGDKKSVLLMKEEHYRRSYA